MGSLPLSDGISSPPATAVTFTVPYGNSLATTAVSTASGFGTAIVTSTNMSLAVLPSIRKKPRLEWRMASDTARFAALVASRPWTSTPMPISVIQRTRAIVCSFNDSAGRLVAGFPWTTSGRKRRIARRRWDMANGTSAPAQRERDEDFLRRSFAVARRSLTHGNHPFAAILVDQQGQVLIEMENGYMPARD